MTSEERQSQLPSKTSGTRHWSENCPICNAPPTGDTWACGRNLTTPDASTGTPECANAKSAGRYIDEPPHFGDTCCGHCGPGLCYVDQMTGA